MAKYILIADDSPTVIQATYDMLEEMGYEVGVAVNGKEAVARVAERAPDLIVMDMEMPKMRGDEAATAIRDNPLWTMIPIVALSARKADSLGVNPSLFNAYLIKPFGFDQLAEVVKKLVGPPEGP